MAFQDTKADHGTSACLNYVSSQIPPSVALHRDRPVMPFKLIENLFSLSIVRAPGAVL